MQKQKNKANTIVTMAAIALFNGIMAGFFLYLYARTTQEAIIRVEDGTLVVTGMYGGEFLIPGKTYLELKDHLPEITRKTNGAGLGNVRKGYFDTVEHGNCLLQVHDGSVPLFLYLQTAETMVIINFSDIEKTRGLYDSINEHIGLE